MKQVVLIFPYFFQHGPDSTTISKKMWNDRICGKWNRLLENLRVVQHYCNIICIVELLNPSMQHLAAEWEGRYPNHDLDVIEPMPWDGDTTKAMLKAKKHE